ncbi:MAG: transketolase [Anaerolineaceae bacterium]|nr:transketolase [Anaerolineaceae bacterium]
MQSNNDDLAIPSDQNKLDVLSANVIRGLVIDAVQKAGVGHPGMPMGMANVAAVLWTRFLRHNPANPNWFNRDRFVLSAGHGSMLLYSLLYLSGYDLPLEQLKLHRQLHSLTPGHPEYRRTPGVETTTGPLGQGLGNAVGMALAEAILAAKFNQPDLSVVDHYTYVIVSDGDLEEGIGHEAASLAGHLQLGKLICLYDDNQMTIDGPTSISFTENVPQRFEAYGWHVQTVDGYDMTAIETAIQMAQAVSNQPTMIVCKTRIGYGSPNKENTSDAHGSPLGAEEIRLTKQALNLPPDESFWVPDEVLSYWRTALTRGAQQEKEWEAHVGHYKDAYPNLANMFQKVLAGELPDGWDAELPTWEQGSAVSPRAASGKVLTALASRIPTLIGGSADLSISNQTRPANMRDIQDDDFHGQYIRFGIREHAMAAALNGMTLHGGLFPYAGTYLVFSDYMRAAIRVAALMKMPTIFVLTHDTVSVGEDGPTHQPIEQIMALRCIPDLLVVRPADAHETVDAWRYALTRRDRPMALLLARHNVPILPKLEPEMGLGRGAYIVVDAEDGKPDVILIGAGSEVAIVMEAREQLEKQGYKVRVVSMPCWELFEEQDLVYREQVLPEAITARVTVEAGVTLGWERYAGVSGISIGINRFGESGKASDVLAYLGMTTERVVEAALTVLAR